jgi:hypothetical protein
LQVVALSPLHAGWPGVQACALHMPVALSQYCVLVHVEKSVELIPSAAQCRTVAPEQKYVVGQHSRQAPWTQTLPASLHDMPPAA